MNVAFIPVRGGSKSIPLKNIKIIAGRPLVYWTVKAASDCDDIDVVYVATDSLVIKETVISFKLPKVRVIGRGENTATDTASTESAMLEFALENDFDNIALIQATSPLLRAEDISEGFKLLKSEGTDSVLSVVRQKRFYWDIDKKGFAHSTNYDVFKRPRRQEFDGNLVENGAFYITTRQGLLKSQNRLSGNIKAFEMDESTYFEVDEPQDWVIIEQLLKKRTESKHENEHIPEIKMFLTDCDGCLTDGGMYYSENGDELKKFNTRDGMGFQMLKERGIITGIVTGEIRELNKRRADKMKVDIIKMGVKDKARVIRELSSEYQIPLKNIAYIGDDINDLEAVEIVGYGCAVNNGIDAIKQKAVYITQKNGGEGAVREVIDRILRM